MARDILSQYGPDTHQPQPPRASSGGVTRARDVHNYCPPQGPTNINDPKGPGLHGTNHGHKQCAVHDKEGHPRISSTSHGNKGSQR
jgi:hypothetical protein